MVGGRGARARPDNGDTAAWRSGRRERFGEEEDEDDMWGPRVSDREMKYTSSYTPAAGPRPCPYVFCGIFVGNEEL